MSTETETATTRPEPFDVLARKAVAMAAGIGPVLIWNGHGMAALWVAIIALGIVETRRLELEQE